MAGQGFKKVFNLKGGIQAWEGEKAEGPVELHLELIRGEETPADIIRVAYGMEHSLGELYRNLQATAGDKEVSELLARLASLEDRHKEYLLDLHTKMELPNMDRESLEASLAPEVAEGGFDIEELLKQNREFLKDVPSLLDLSMMLETQALDLYLRFSQKVEADEAKKVLYRIADEEKKHLKWLGDLRDRRN